MSKNFKYFAKIVIYLTKNKTIEVFWIRNIFVFDIKLLINCNIINLILIITLNLMQRCSV